MAKNKNMKWVYIIIAGLVIFGLVYYFWNKPVTTADLAKEGIEFIDNDHQQHSTHQPPVEYIDDDQHEEHAPEFL